MWASGLLPVSLWQLVLLLELFRMLSGDTDGWPRLVKWMWGPQVCESPSAGGLSQAGYPSLPPFIHLSIHSPICSLIHPHAHSSIHLPSHPSIHPYIHISTCWSIHPSIHPCILPSSIHIQHRLMFKSIDFAIIQPRLESQLCHSQVCDLG